MGMSLKINFLIFLSITSVHLITGYAWSDKLDRSNHFTLEMHEDGDEDSIQENTIENKDGDAMLESSSGGGSSNARSEQDTVVSARNKDLTWNRALNMEDETALQEMFNIH
jgi:hypothetical protein